jgi:hypothetical protein
MMMRMLRILVALGLSALLLCSCGANDAGSHRPQHLKGLFDGDHAQATYFDGSVLVDYRQSGNWSNDNDALTITIYEPGSYRFLFSQTPGESPRDGRGNEVMPQGFDAVIAQAPRVRVVSQWKLPDFLRVTIVRADSAWESHDFS